jgi:Family of unknown function (DUF5683)
MTRGKTKRAMAATVAAIFLLSGAGPASASSAVVKSILLPGLGQAQQGHYTKATIFASAAILSWVGLFATQVTYAGSVEKYENSKRTYLYYGKHLESGTIVRQEDIEASYTATQAAYDQAAHDEKWRNAFIGALVVTYAVNIIDILRSKPDTGEVTHEPDVSLEWHGDGVRVVRTVHF